MQKVETRITSLEKELAVYEAQLAAATYANAAQLKHATVKFEAVKKELGQVNTKWEALAERMEALKR